MENATKALLMAAGVLLTMLIVMLLLFFKGKITEFYDEQGKIEDIENVEKFNKQFTNYERKKVYGYELISLANMLEDYNTRQSDADGAQNDEKYKPIKLVFSFPNRVLNEVINTIWYSDEVNHFFRKNKNNYEQSKNKTEIVEIINKATEIENRFSNMQIATKLAKSIDSLIIDDKDSDRIDRIAREQGITVDDAGNKLKEQSIADFNAMTYNKLNITSYGALESELIKIKQYYEYYQFKRAVFDCKEIEYDNEVGGTGRIIGMTFEFTGKVE